MFKRLGFWSVIFGLAFITIGIAGFTPEFTRNGMLFGIFAVSTVHNSVHIIIGVIALLAATKRHYAKLFFRIFGILFLVAAITGFARNGNLILMHINMADNLLILGVSIIALYFGFVFESK